MHNTRKILELSIAELKQEIYNSDNFIDNVSDNSNITLEKINNLKEKIRKIENKIQALINEKKSKSALLEEAAQLQTLKKAIFSGYQSELNSNNLNANYEISEISLSSNKSTEEEFCQDTMSLARLEDESSINVINNILIEKINDFRISSENISLKIQELTDQSFIKENSLNELSLIYKEKMSEITENFKKISAKIEKRKEKLPVNEKSSKLKCFFESEFLLIDDNEKIVIDELVLKKNNQKVLVTVK